MIFSLPHSQRQRNLVVRPMFSARQMTVRRPYVLPARSIKFGISQNLEGEDDGEGLLHQSTHFAMANAPMKAMMHAQKRSMRFSGIMSRAPRCRSTGC